jgi:WD40 repeat protein
MGAGAKTLKEAIVEAFSVDDLRSLCFNLSVDPERIPYIERGKETWAGEIIRTFQRQDRLNDLLDECVRQRPNIAWHELTKPVLQPEERLPDAVFTVSGLENPYLGLRAFTYSDKSAYAGRNRLADEAVELIASPGRQMTLLFVTGTSGSGKSSFVQAGLIPKLEDFYLQRGKQVKRAVLRPGKEPTLMLEDALEQLGQDVNSIKLLVIDQFEEVFTESSLNERQSLVNWLLELPSFSRSATHVIVTIRSDFLADLFENKALWDIAKQGIELRVMSVDELRQAILRPLQARYPHAERQFEAALVDKLATDASADPALLPLLQVSLAELWRKGQLTLSAYTDLTKAIRDWAEQVYKFADYSSASPKTERDPSTQRGVLDTLLDFVKVSLDDDSRRDVRIRRPLSALGQAKQAIAQDLINARLLSISLESAVEQVTIIHESLIGNWDRLRSAIEDRRQQLQQRERFEQQLAEWKSHDQSNAYLLSGGRLVQAQELRSSGDIALQSPKAQAFLNESVALEEQGRQREVRRLRSIVFGSVVAAFIMLVLAGFAFQSRNQALQSESNERNARATEQIVSARNVDLAQLNGNLATQSANTAATAIVEATRGATLANQNANLATRSANTAATAVVESSRRATSEAIANEQRRAAERQTRLAVSRELAANADSQLQIDKQLLTAVQAFQVADTAEARSALIGAIQRSAFLERVEYGTDQTQSIAYNSKIGMLATGSADGAITLWELSDQSHKKLVTFTGSNAGAEAIIFSPDGLRLIVGHSDGNLLIVDLPSLLPGETNKYSITQIHADQIRALSVFGNLLATASDDKAVKLIDYTDINSLTVLSTITLTQPVGAVRFSTDGAMLVSSSGKFLHFWNVADPTSPGELVTPLEDVGSINSLAFGLNDRILASATDSGLSLWDTNSLTRTTAPLQLEEDSTLFLDVEFAENGSMLAGSIANALIGIWDVSQPYTPTLLINPPLQGHLSFISDITFIGNAPKLASVSTDSKIIFWDLSDLKLAKEVAIQLDSHEKDYVFDLRFNSSGTLLASSNGQEISLWRINEGLTAERVGKSPQHKSGRIRDMAFSPKSNILVTGDSDGYLTFWDADDLEESFAVHYTNTEISSLAYRPNSDLLVVGTKGSGFSFLDTSNPKNPKLVFNYPYTEEGSEFSIEALLFNTDGTLLTTLASKGSITLWQIETDLTLTKLSTREVGFNISIHPDGTRLASGDIRYVYLWDISDPREIVGLAGIDTLANSEPKAALGPDGRTLAWGALPGTLTLYDVSRPESPIQLGSNFDAPSWVWSIAYSPKGNIVATGLTNGSVVLWNVDPKSWINIACNKIGRQLTELELKTLFENQLAKDVKPACT